VAIEPNVALHATLRDVARRRGVAGDVRDATAEELPLADASVDAVISSLVLCTVRSPERALAEVRRVLRPGGRFWSLEHVAAPEGTALARVQRTVRRPWAGLFGGCQVHRDTARLLLDAGFSSLELTPFTVRTPLVPIRPHLAAVAVR
jgi:ubiquinone/menaquinone biosynthesis C-methylase UbiE